MIIVRFILPQSALNRRQTTKKHKNGGLMDIYERLAAGEWVPPEPLKPEDYTAIYKWYHDEPNPFIESVNKKANKENRYAWEDLVNADRVVTRAYGPELELIRTHFQNIPWVINQRNECEWTGETAKFIALNFDFKK